MGRVPLSHEVMLKLGALRMQVLDGDYETGSFLLVRERERERSRGKGRV